MLILSAPVSLLIALSIKLEDRGPVFYRINDFNEWVKLDLQYIDNWSVWLDMKILAKTAWVVLKGTGQ
jgi:lipopolysaccharide/colanic/teichoic acid biosynthesis glycosyltransferase